MKKRIGILTSGGDCPGLNATIRGVAKACYEKFGEDVQIVGIEDGYYGLINNMCKEMKQSDFWYPYHRRNYFRHKENTFQENAGHRRR